MFKSFIKRINNQGPTIRDIIIGPIAQNIQLTPFPSFNVAHVVSNFSSNRLWSCMMAAIIFMADIATLKRGEGGFTCEFLQMLKKYLIDLSVPNFNVTDCSLVPCGTPAGTDSHEEKIKFSNLIL